MSTSNLRNSIEIRNFINKADEIQNGNFVTLDVINGNSAAYENSEELEILENEKLTLATEKKRCRNFYCYSCCQYKPRSTKARFKVCKHVSCYHCLRKALQIEYWATKKNEWTNYRARCPFCKIELDWNLMKPHIALSPEAKLTPLMSLYLDVDRKEEALKVIKSFFPNGVPVSFICEDEIDMSLTPSVAQILFGFEFSQSNETAVQLTNCDNIAIENDFEKSENSNFCGMAASTEMIKYKDVFYCWRNELMNENQNSQIASDCSTVGSPNINKRIKYHNKDNLFKSISTTDSWSVSNSEFTDDDS